jgi:peptidoglycan/LPS O-acetylase OafA/YrhL
MVGPQPKYYPAFDYLRIVLAIVVAVGHSGFVIWDQAGNYAVQVFFALSGWLIGGILLRSKPGDLPQFYFNRAARIWIPYLVAIALLMAASLLKEPVTRKWLEIFFYDVTFVYNFFGPPQLASFKDALPLQGTGNHFWSICAEEQFYLIAPFLITLLATAGRSIWFWCIIAAIAFASPFSGYFAAISLGVFAAVVRAHYGDWNTRRLSRWGLLIIATALFFAIYLELMPYIVGASLSSVAIVLLLAQPGNHSQVATFLGGISFPMYLNHWIGVFIANVAFGKFGLRDTTICHVSGVIISLVVAVILYAAIDRNVKNRRDQYFSDIRGGRVAACGFALVAIGVVGGLFLT